MRRFSAGTVSPGDWLYVKGNRRPGKIKSMFHTDKEDIIDINYGDGPEEKLSANTMRRRIRSGVWLSSASCAMR